MRFCMPKHALLRLEMSAEPTASKAFQMCRLIEIGLVLSKLRRSEPQIAYSKAPATSRCAGIGAA